MGLVGDDPLDGGDDSGHIGRPVGPGDLDRHDVGSRGHTHVLTGRHAPVAGDDAGHVGPVTVTVDAVAIGCEVHLRDDPVAEIGRVDDARVQHRDADARAVELVTKARKLEDVVPDVVGGIAVVLTHVDAGGSDLPVPRNREYCRGRSQRGKGAGGERRGEAADHRKLVGDGAAQPPDQRLRGLGIRVGFPNDHRDRCTRVRARRPPQGWIEFGG